MAKLWSGDTYQNGDTSSCKHNVDYQRLLLWSVNVACDLESDLIQLAQKEEVKYIRHCYMARGYIDIARA